MPGSIVVRLLTPTDADAYLRVRLSQVELEPNAFAESPIEVRGKTAAATAERLAAPRDVSFIAGAFVDGAIVATAGYFRRMEIKTRHKGRVWGVFVKDQPVFAAEKVRYVGEEVAAVAAVDLDTARRALDLIEIDWEPLPAVFDPREAMLPDAPPVHASGNVAASIHVERGSVEDGFARSDVVVEETFQSHPQWHAAIETIGRVAEFSPSGKLTLWMNTQTLFMARGRIAWALGLSEGDVRIIQPYVGGGFGGKSCDDNNALVCAVLARATGRPVKLINTREAAPHRRRQWRLLRQGAGRVRRDLAPPRHGLRVSECQGRRVPGVHQQGAHGRLPRLRQPVSRMGR